MGSKSVVATTGKNDPDWTHSDRVAYHIPSTHNLIGVTAMGT